MIPFGSSLYQNLALMEDLFEMSQLVAGVSQDETTEAKDDPGHQLALNEGNAAILLKSVESVSK